MAFPVARYNSTGLFHMGHLRKHLGPGLSKISWQDFRQLWQRLMSKYSLTSEKMTSSVLPENGCRPFCASTVTTRMTCTFWRVMHILKVKCLVNMFYEIFHKFLTSNHSMWSLCTHLFSTCLCASYNPSSSESQSLLHLY
jgi:hypothetical protein